MGKSQFTTENGYRSHGSRLSLIAGGVLASGVLATGAFSVATGSNDASSHLAYADATEPSASSLETTLPPLSGGIPEPTASQQITPTPIDTASTVATPAPETTVPAEPEPSVEPTSSPSPSSQPASEDPTSAQPAPTVPVEPSDQSTVEPTLEPSEEPQPTQEPTSEPTIQPTERPTAQPTGAPEPSTTAEPSPEPTQNPEPSAEPTTQPTQQPTTQPSNNPEPSGIPEPTQEPTQEPTRVPEPTGAPTANPIPAEPTAQPSNQVPVPVPETTSTAQPTQRPETDNSSGRLYPTSPVPDATSPAPEQSPRFELDRDFSSAPNATHEPSELTVPSDNPSTDSGFAAADIFNNDREPNAPGADEWVSDFLKSYQNDDITNGENAGISNASDDSDKAQAPVTLGSNMRGENIIAGNAPLVLFSLVGLGGILAVILVYRRNNSSS